MSKECQCEDGGLAWWLTDMLVNQSQRCMRNAVEGNHIIKTVTALEI